LLVLGIVAGVVLVLAGVFLALQQNRPAQVAATQPTTVSQAAEVPFPDVPRIGLADARARIDAGQAVAVDTRSRQDFEAEHIPGAVSMPLAEFEARLSELPKNTEIITYCT
jgi:3-mercaptopyruvate sulfurtransferase SseA